MEYLFKIYLHAHKSHTVVEKQEIFACNAKFFRQIKLELKALVKALISRNFCDKKLQNSVKKREIHCHANFFVKSIYSKVLYLVKR